MVISKIVLILTVSTLPFSVVISFIVAYLLLQIPMNTALFSVPLQTEY